MINIIFKIFLCLFFSIHLNAQNSSGKITYIIRKNPINALENKIKNQDKYKDVMLKVENKITELRFILEFNRDHSIFYLQDNLSLDGSEFYTEMALAATRGNSVFYADRKDETLTEEVFSFGRDFLIKSSMEDMKWELTKESKTIGKLLCFKATAMRENFGPVEPELRYSLYTAWYCPELAFRFGPYEVCGLPGLVLEYTNGIMTYTANDLNLRKETIKIKTPDKGQIISKKEFEIIGKKAFESNSFIRD